MRSLPRVLIEFPNTALGTGITHNNLPSHTSLFYLTVAEFTSCKPGKCLPALKNEIDIDIEAKTLRLNLY